MEQYIVFAGENFYPLGGWCDYIGSYSTVEEARNAANNRECDWWQIVDITSKNVIEDRWFNILTGGFNGLSDSS